MRVTEHVCSVSGTVITACRANGDGTYTDLLYNAAHYFFIDGEMDGDYYVDDPDAWMKQIVLTEAEYLSPTCWKPASATRLQRQKLRQWNDIR